MSSGMRLNIRSMSTASSLSMDHGDLSPGLWEVAKRLCAGTAAMYELQDCFPASYHNLQNSNNRVDPT